MVVRISGDGSISGLTDWEATSVTHPESADTNITLADDGSVAFDSIPADIQAAIDNIPVLAGIGSNVVATFKNDVFSTTSTSFVDITGLSVSITPTSDTSKILVIAYLSVGMEGQRAAMFNLRRGSTNIAQPSGGTGSTVELADESNLGQQNSNALSVVFLDSPNTTLATSYSFQMRTPTGAVVFLNQNGRTSRTTTSSITVIEVAA